MKSWFLERGSLENIIDEEMMKVKFYEKDGKKSKGF